MRTVPDVARQLNRHPETIRRWIREGKLRSVKVGTQHLIDDVDLASVVPGSRPAVGSDRFALTDESIPSTGGSGGEGRSRQIGETILPFLPTATARGPGVASGVDPWLPAIVGRIVRLVDPVRILVFGSRSRGDAGPESDYDILVVLDDAPNPRERRIAIRRAIADLPVAVDIVVVAADSVGRRRADGRGVPRAALVEGVEIYARP